MQLQGFMVPTRLILAMEEIKKDTGWSKSMQARIALEMFFQAYMGNRENKTWVVQYLTDKQSNHGEGEDNE